MAKKTVLFVLAVAVQSLILAAIPIGKIYTLQTGKEIRVETVPVDPYDILSGYYVVLSYDFSQVRREFEPGQDVYVILEKDQNEIYKAKSYYAEWPKKVGGDQVVIKGRASGRDLKFGIEKFYMPEEMRREINDQIRKWQGEGQVLVDIKVDKKGSPAIMRLIINDKIYEY